ncbi:MAG: glycosyltransferase family 2 protein [Brevundimonas sp.]
MSGDVAVLIPTLRRPDSLARALASVQAQTGVDKRLAEVVVVDNDPEGTALSTVEASTGPFPVRYVHAPDPGVATARNAGLAATSAPLIAFLDDDEAASPDWLAALLAAQAETRAEVVFGPIQGRAPDAPAWLQPYLEAFFGREGPAVVGHLTQPFGCGNSLMVRVAALPGPAPFNPAAALAGGEDDGLFSALAARGGGFGWAPNARVEEFAPAHRATLRYALTRAFAYGQGPSQTARRHGRSLGLVHWMAIGAAQVVVFGGLAAVGFLIWHPRRAWWLDRAARGLGKLLWMPGLEPAFYGAAEMARLQRAGAKERPVSARNA